MKQPDWEKAQAYVLNRLANGLSPDLTYHGLHHTRDDVLPAVERLANLSGLGKEDTLILKTAALFHDIGYLEQYDHNEPVGACIAVETLPGFGFCPQQIQVIEQLILATQVPQCPHNHLEQIICDADMDSLGRDDFLITSHNLWLERLAHYNVPIPQKEWYLGQLHFLLTHTYFTDFARSLREAGKQKNIQELRKLLKSLE